MTRSRSRAGGDAPHHRALARLLAALATGLCSLSSDARADDFNVSQIATGTHQPLSFAQAALYPELPCGACSYSAVSTAIINPDSAAKLMPKAWPPPSQATLPTPPLVERRLDTPQGMVDADGVTNYYDSDTWRRAAVSFDASDKSAASATYASGASGEVLVYHIKISNSAVVARDYFVEFAVPQKTRGVQPAWSLVTGGDNGGTYVYHRQDSAFSRSVVEVLVDGLPVWSQSSSYHFPSDFAGNAWDKLLVEWGQNQNGRVRLYLGELAPQATLTVDYAVRTEVRADADECGFEYNGSWGESEKYHHCFELIEKRSLPATASATPALDLKVYAKEVP